MPTEQEILGYLDQYKAVLTDSHFVFTKGGHGSAYINMRKVAHQAKWLRLIGRQMGSIIAQYKTDLILGPETLGRTLAQYAALTDGSDTAIWCDIQDIDGRKVASFPSKLDFSSLVEGHTVAIVDDLLTPGSSIKAAAELVAAHGGMPVLGVAVVRRTPDVSAADCGVTYLKVLADVPGYDIFSPEECVARGPCAQRVPVVLRPGHGHEWAKDHPDYPTA